MKYMKYLKKKKNHIPKQKVWDSHANKNPARNFLSAVTWFIWLHANKTPSFPNPGKGFGEIVQHRLIPAGDAWYVAMCDGL